MKKIGTMFHAWWSKPSLASEVMKELTPFGKYTIGVPIVIFTYFILSLLTLGLPLFWLLDRIVWPPLKNLSKLFFVK